MDPLIFFIILIFIYSETHDTRLRPYLLTSIESSLYTKIVDSNGTQKCILEFKISTSLFGPLSWTNSP